jgi:hypothetical protein
VQTADLVSGRGLCLFELARLRSCGTLTSESAECGDELAALDSVSPFQHS